MSKGGAVHLNIIYVDCIFAMNFIMDSLILYMVKKFRRLSATPLWIALGASFGALMTVLMCFTHLPTIIESAISLGIVPYTMLLITFHIRKIKTNIINLLILYINSTFLGGIVQIILYHTTLNHYLYITHGHKLGGDSLWIKFAAGLPVVIGAGILFVKVCLFHKKDHANKCKVSLIIHGIHVQSDALIDTGNSLYEPISRRPVCVIYLPHFRKYFKESDSEKIRVVPMETVGGTKGILYAVCIDGMEVCVENKVYYYKNVYTALEKREFNGCQVLLHPDFMGMERTG